MCLPHRPLRAGATTSGNATCPHRTRGCPLPLPLLPAWTLCGSMHPTRTCSALTRPTWWCERLLRPLYQRWSGSKGQVALAGRPTDSPLHYVHSAAPRASLPGPSLPRHPALSPKGLQPGRGGTYYASHSPTTLYKTMDLYSMLTVGHRTLTTITSII